MKKLMIAAAIVCAAVSVRASSCDWGADSEGWVWSYYDNGTTHVDTYYDGTVGTYWLVALTANSTAGISVDNTGKLVMDSKVGSVTTGGAGAFDAPNGEPAAAGSIQGVTAKDNGKYYALIIYDTDNNLYGISDTWMMNGVQDEPAPIPGDYMKFSNHTGADFGYTEDTSRYMVADTLATATPTPEPTSGLLLLLGVAGLALRRKQK